MSPGEEEKNERHSRLELLRKSPALRAIVLSRLLSVAGTWLAYVALTVDIYARTGSGLWVSAVLFAGFAPSVAGAVLLAPLVDRLERKRLLIGSELVGVAVFVALVFTGSPLLVVALAGLAGLGAALFQPALAAALPNLVEEGDLTATNSLTQTVATAGLAAGPVLAGVLISAFGVRAAYAVNAGSFLVSAGLLARIPARKLHSERRLGEGHLRQLRDGAHALIDAPLLRSVLGAYVLSSAAAAGINVGEILLAKSVFHAGTLGFGLLASAGGVGLVCGSLASARVLDRWPAPAVFAAALVLAGAGFAAAALAPTIRIAAVFACGAGIANGLFVAAVTLVVQRAVSDEIRGRVFALLGAGGETAMGLGMFAAGFVAATGARTLWLAAAGLLVGAALVAARGARARLVSNVPAVSSA